MSSIGPPDVGGSAHYHASDQTAVPAHDDWLTLPEADRLNRMRYTKRRDESRLGRWTAKHAVARALDLPRTSPQLREVVIRNAKDGAPEAFVGSDPASVAISMTDRAGWAVCVVAGGVEGVGCDLELVEPRSYRFVRDYFTPAEQDAVAEAPDAWDLMANLIWSAKESALKVLRQGLRLDTRTVEVALDDERPDGWSSLVVTASSGQRFPGWWTRHGDFVLTYCATGATGAPVAMDDPSPLATATPAHSWMANPLRPTPSDS